MTKVYFCNQILNLINMLFIAITIPILCIVFLGYLVYSAPEARNEM